MNLNPTFSSKNDQCFEQALSKQLRFMVKKADKHHLHTPNQYARTEPTSPTTSNHQLALHLLPQLLELPSFSSSLLEPRTKLTLTHTNNAKNNLSPLPLPTQIITTLSLQPSLPPSLPPPSPSTNLTPWPGHSGQGS